MTQVSSTAVSLADAWEEHAAQWIPWARAVGFDGFWDGTWPALRCVLPNRDGLSVEVGCGEGPVRQPAPCRWSGLVVREPVR